MSILNTTIDDINPLIEYQPPGAWIQINGSTDDSVSEKSFKETSTQTRQMGASASFSFNGTSVIIYGGKNSDHGNYSVNIDGSVQYFSGFAPSPGEYQVPLFVVSDLWQGPHLVTITNEEYNALDIDSINWASEIGPNNSGQITRIFADDIDEVFRYDPESAWTRTYDVPNFNDGTAHSTSNAGASVSYTFTVSEAISIYGTVGPQSGKYTVNLDNGPDRTYQGTKMTYRTRMLIFFASNLGGGNHTLSVTSQGEGNFDFDYAVINRVDSYPTGNTSAPNPIPSGLGLGGSSGLPPGAIAGIAVGVVLVVALTISLFVLLRLNKTLWVRLQRGYMVQSQFDTFPPSSTDSEDSGLGFHIASDGKGSRDFLSHVQSPSTELREESAIRVVPNIHRFSGNSNLSSSASTLVAEDGSHTTRRTRRPGLKRIDRRGMSHMRINTRSSTVSSMPPQLPTISPVGCLMPIESISELSELPVTAIMDSGDRNTPVFHSDPAPSDRLPPSTPHSLQVNTSVAPVCSSGRSSPATILASDAEFGALNFSRLSTVTGMSDIEGAGGSSKHTVPSMSTLLARGRLSPLGSRGAGSGPVSSGASGRLSPGTSNPTNWEVSGVTDPGILDTLGSPPPARTSRRETRVSEISTMPLFRSKRRPPDFL